MPDAIGWEDYEDIGILLHEKFSETDPLSVRFTDLLHWICELDEFTGDAKDSSEGKLERIQMAWLEEWQDADG